MLPVSHPGAQHKTKMPVKILNVTLALVLEKILRKPEQRPHLVIKGFRKREVAHRYVNMIHPDHLDIHRLKPPARLMP
jgi:hypothetical protein